MVGKKGFLVGVLLLVAVVLLTPALAPKKVQNTLDDLVMVSSRLRVPQNIESIDNLRATRSRAESLSAQDQEAIVQLDRLSDGWDGFLTHTGGQWQLLLDTRSGMPALAEGSGEPWIPGAGNSLRAEALGTVTASKMENIARDFMLRNPNLFPMSQDELVLVPEGTVEVGGYFWHVQFQYVKNGVPVEGARVVFRVNNGNLVQFGMENILPNFQIDTVPSFAKETAWQMLDGYIGGFGEKDSVLEPGRLNILPFAPEGDVGSFRGTTGKGSEYRLVYELIFHREGVMGTWMARIDAHSGEILSFVDTNKYGSVTGGIYPNSNLDTEVIRPLPFITVTNSTSKTCDAGGNYSFATGTATASLKGKYVTVTDSCGTSSLSTSTSPGDLAFSKSTGTDCTNPGVGGSGNTHAARTGYFHLTIWKEKALGFLPSNTWLAGAVGDKVNLSQTCNAYWDGSAVNFFKSGGGCSNTGELPTVFLHEVGHGLDSNDGSGTSTVGSSESYGDANGFLATHSSCLGINFIPGQNCTGYGNACTSCTGIRDADYAKHSSSSPATPSQLTGSSGYHCSADSSYPGPCGKEGHCESYIMSEVIWDLGYRDLVSAGLDANTAWYITDRLFFLTRPSSTDSYSCPSVTTTTGCGTGNWFTTFRAIDDDDGNLTNGTPHGAAIYAAFSRHATACTSVTGYNTTYAAYTTPSKPTLTASTATAGQVNLSWAAVTGATRYTVLRNEMSATSGMIPLTSTPITATTYTDTAVAPGIAYYYSVVGVGGSSLSTIGPMATVVSATPTTGGTTTYSISGTVSGAASVTIACTGQTSVVTSGAYTFSGLANGTYTITPSLTGYTFSPTSYSVTVSGANVTGKDFTATAIPTYSISGTVSGATSVTVACTGQTSVTTSGAYTFSGLSNGTYTVTPNKSGYTFSPASYSVTISGANATGKDFTATAATTYSISGTVSGATSVTVACTGQTSVTTSGAYTFSGLSNGTYTVTPSKTGYTFSPASYSVTISSANVTGKDFTGTVVSGNVLTSGVGVSGSAAASSYVYYTFAVPSGATNLTVTLTGLSADVDLYDMAPTTAGGAASNPTTSSYTGRSWNSGTTSESLSHSSPTYGTWAIAAYGYAAGSYTVTATYTAGGTTYSISGTVSGAVASGVTITAGSSTATSASDGTYTLSGLANGTYTVTPSKSGYTFSPTSISVTIASANQTGKNFTSTASGGGTTTNILVSPGFEAATNWTWGYTGTTHTWRTTVTTPVAPHGGSYDAQLCGYSSTYYQSQTENLTQTVAIPSAATAATLNFYYYIKTAETTTSTAYDKLTITVENTSGTVLATLTTLSNLNKTTAWTAKTGLNLLSYKGQTVVIRFKGTTDSSLGTIFLLDDVALNVTQ
jgi:trimeric autotransporter adhesin